MEGVDLVALLSPEGLSILKQLPDWSASEDVALNVAKLRRAGYSPQLVSAALTQSRLRARARAKFSDHADRMLFTEAGLEQATRLPIAGLHAKRFKNAGISEVLDLGCGLGGDALAFASLGLAVHAVDNDELVASCAAYNLSSFTGVRVEHATAESVAQSLDRGMSEASINTDHRGRQGESIGVWLDPARRTTRQGATLTKVAPSDYLPSLDFAFDLAKRYPLGMKLGPATDRGLVPANAEAQWVSHEGDVVELVLWLGSLARPGVGRSALIMRNGVVHTLDAPADSVDVEPGPLGRYLYEPDGSVIRARLIGDLARLLDAHPVGSGLAYLTGDELRLTHFARAFRIVELLPMNVAKLRKVIRDREIGVLEIKKRGVDIDPSSLRRDLKLSGSRTGTLILTRVNGKHTALLCERAD